MQDSSRTLSFPSPFLPEELWILGAGRFGYMAAQRLSQRHPDASFKVIDVRREKLDRIQKELGFAVYQEDAISFLAKAYLPKDVWVIPAVPLHVAFRWLLARLEGMGEIHALPVPETVDRQVPNPIRTETGTVYTSFATFICPDACSEPEQLCTSTGKLRPDNLFELLNRIEIMSAGVVVVRSLQLAPGVGGYQGGYLENILHGLSKEAGSYLVATSCRCHGVVDMLNWTPRYPRY